MAEVQVGKPMRGAVATIAFRVVPKGANLFSTEVLLLKGSTIIEKRTGEGTLMGHAIGQAQELLGHYTLSELETPAEDYFRAVTVL